MGILKRLGVETAFQTFNNYLSNITRKRNASVVGPSKQIAGEFPEVDFPRLFEYYHGWDQIKRSVDTMHQKFMGSGIEIISDSEEFDVFIKKWMEVVNFQKKMSDFFLNVFITGNGIMEKQYTDDGRIGNIEVIPMQTLYRIFRDEYGNELKLVQNIDGIFKELDPAYYLHWTINNPDRQAFGKSEFHTLAAPRKVASKIDPNTGEAINPERNLVSLLDAQAELQNAEVEIKRIMAKPRIFASFAGMPQNQLAKLQAELQDDSSSQTIWAFDKKAEMVEAQYQGQGKYQSYGENVDSHIDIGTGFASQVISHPGGFSYSSSQTPFDVLDQRMVDMQADAREMIKDFILRPMAESWGIDNFDDMDVTIHFQPSVRRLTMEDIQRLPLDSVSPHEKREILKSLHIPLDDNVFEEFQNSGKQDDLISSPQKEPLQSPMSPVSSVAGGTKNAQQKEENPMEKDRPKPATQSTESVHPIYNDPTLIESYVQDLVHEALSKERMTMSPQGNAGNMFTPNGVQSDDGDPEITDQSVLDQLLTRFNSEQDWKDGEPITDIDPLIDDAKNDLFSGYNDPEQDFLVNDTRDKAGTIDTPYPSTDTDAGGLPINTPADPQRTKGNRYPDVLNNSDDEDRRKKIGEMLRGRRR
ncbi:phage portal protein [bacterium]|nr:phage portal protein [bacterium]